MNNETPLRSDLSLLFPNPEGSDMLFSSKGISEENAEQLGLYSLLDMRTLEIGAFFTDKPEIIRYRQATIKDILSVPELSGVLRRILPFLTVPA